MTVVTEDANQVANRYLEDAIREDTYSRESASALISIAASLRLISLSLFNIAKNTRPEEDYR